MKNGLQKERVLRAEKKIYSYLNLMGIETCLGWNTEETDQILAEKFVLLEAHP